MPTFLLLLLLLCPAPAVADPFPRPPELEDQVQFWVRIYSEVTTDGGLVHDSRDLGIVYEKIEFRGGASRRSRQRHTEQVKDKYDAILHTLSSGKRTGLSADEQRVLALFPDGVSDQTLAAARRRIRFQLGQADKFRAGVVRAGRWEPHIMKVLADHGVPYELAELPHVESSYNPKAYSHAGAAGLWQFTRSTGRLFMRIDHVVDERMDPYLSSIAAARLLLANYRRTGTWPTAITAYNHGTAGMERAIRQLGTRDIATIVHRYQSRSFGFASRNFYAEFLAAVEVSRNAEHYFGALAIDPAEDLDTLQTDHYYAPATLARILGVGESTLREYNRALLSPVWSGAKYVPKGYVLRFPRQPDRAEPALLLAEVPASERILRQRPDKAYRVRPGDTLSGIARRFGVSMNELVAMNGLRSRHRIRIGQQLKLPTDEGPTTIAMVRDHDRNARPKLERPPDGRYVVHRGDTLSGIATTFAVSVEELVAANDLRNRNRLAVGQVLFIPGEGSPTAATYVVRSGDTLEQIAARHGVSLAALEERNDIRNRNRIRVGQVIAIPGRGEAPSGPRPETTYVVRRGDNLAAIAARHGTTVEAIQAASGLRNRNHIQVGQELRIPGTEPVAVASRTPPAAAAAEPEPEPTPEADAGLAGTVASAAVAAVVAATAPLPEPETEIEPQIEAEAAPTVPDTGDAPARTAEAAPLAPDEAALPFAPRRYAVAADGSIVVHPEETLGHYADWLEVKTQRLRDLNGLRFGDALAIGRRVRLDFSEVDRHEFEKRRLDHHRSLQTAFFDDFAVAGTDHHVMRRGETLWKISRGKYAVPVWLIQQYNPGLDVNALRPGMRIRIPRVEPRASS